MAARMRPGAAFRVLVRNTRPDREHRAWSLTEDALRGRPQDKFLNSSAAAGPDDHQVDCHLSNELRQYCPKIAGSYD